MNNGKYATVKCTALSCDVQSLRQHFPSNCTGLILQSASSRELILRSSWPGSGRFCGGRRAESVRIRWRLTGQQICHMFPFNGSKGAPPRGLDRSFHSVPAPVSASGSAVLSIGRSGLSHSPCPCSNVCNWTTNLRICLLRDCVHNFPRSIT
jgi:hypothetical protein